MNEEEEESVEVESEVERPTLKDVAVRAGVSVATVARVIRSPHRVSEKTLAHVREVVEELEYVPSQASFWHEARSNHEDYFRGRVIVSGDDEAHADSVEDALKKFCNYLGFEN